MATNYALKAMEAEQAIIGAALVDDSWVMDSGLSPGDFLNRRHCILWSAILQIVEDKQQVDMLTITEKVGKGDEVALYISDLMRNTPGSGNAMAYVDILRRYAGKHRAAMILGKAITELDSSDDSVDSTICELMALNSHSTKHEHTTKEYLTLANKYIDDMRDGKIKVLSTGLSCLDKKLGGFHDSDLIVIAGRPAMGKTALMLNMALKCQEPVGIISGEQPAEQMALRLVAMTGRVDVEKLRSIQKMQEDDWKRVAAGFKTLFDSNKILINDKPMPALADIQRQARKWKHQDGVKAVFIDYTQRIAGGDTRAPKHERIGEIVKGLKSLARELNIPVIALAQVSRDVEKRPIKKPGMADISDSSEIEKEADQVITLYRDEVYNANSEHKGIIEMIICKNRHGGVGFVRAAWIDRFMLAETLASDDRRAQEERQ